MELRAFSQGSNTDKKWKDKDNNKCHKIKTTVCRLATKKGA